MTEKWDDRRDIEQSWSQATEEGLQERADAARRQEYYASLLAALAFGGLMLIFLLWLAKVVLF